MANASLVLGIPSLFTWLYWIVGFPITLCGIVISVIAVVKAASRNGKSIVGLVMSGIGFVLTMLNITFAWFTPIVY
jgi:hypothetical protein